MKLLQILKQYFKGPIGSISILFFFFFFFEAEGNRTMHMPGKLPTTTHNLSLLELIQSYPMSIKAVAFRKSEQWEVCSQLKCLRYSGTTQWAWLRYSWVIHTRWLPMSSMEAVPNGTNESRCSPVSLVSVWGWAPSTAVLPWHKICWCAPGAVLVLLPKEEHKVNKLLGVLQTYSKNLNRHIR